MRLDKLLSNFGFGSRKEVKGLLKKKWVTVNGKIETKAEAKADSEKGRHSCRWRTHQLPGIYLPDDEQAPRRPQRNGR